MPLYGHEMDDTISPFDTNLGYGVRMDKAEFVGKEGLLKRGEPKIARVGLEMIDRGVMREHQDLYSDDRKIGHTTSGTHCPYLRKAVAMALVEKNAAIMVRDSECHDKGLETLLNLLNNDEQMATMRKNIKQMARRKAADRIVDEIDKILNIQK